VASRKGYLFTMKFLFESLKGRDVLMYCHSKGFMKNNLMHEAVANGHLKIVKYLEGNGFDFQSVNKFGIMRSCAVESGNLELVQYVIDKGNDLNYINTILKKFHTSGSVNNLQKSGRPHKSNERSDPQLSRQSKINSKSIAAELRDEWDIPGNILVITVKRILRKYVLLGRIAARKLILPKVHILRRKKWCLVYKGLEQSFWDNVIYSDECRLEMHPRRREYVRRPTNTRYHERFTSKTVKHGGKSWCVSNPIGMYPGKTYCNKQQEQQTRLPK